jgi:hypothetical protein
MRPAGKRHKRGNVTDIKELAARAIAAFDALSPEEQRAHRREQRISWVFGDHCLRMTESGSAPAMTREQAAAIVDRWDAEEW